jgi:hypothetical protein
VIVLRASVEDVQAVLSKALKPGRDVVTVVHFVGGSLEEKLDPSYRESARPAEAKEEPEDPPKKEEEPAVTKTPEKKADAIATVAAPQQGCPLPAFERAEIRATRVLEAFLTPEQIEDFRTRQQFVVLGADTGHRYMLTSRHADRALARAGGRSVFDLDEETPYCVHDWTVPAAEELLSLACFLGLPGRESYVRYLEE